MKCLNEDVEGFVKRNASFRLQMNVYFELHVIFVTLKFILRREDHSETMKIHVHFETMKFTSKL